MRWTLIDVVVNLIYSMNAIRISNGLDLKMKGRWRIGGNATYSAFGNKKYKNVQIIFWKIFFFFFKKKFKKKYTGHTKSLIEEKICHM